MPELDHRKSAADYAKLAMTAQYVDEAYPLRLATVAQAHAMLAVADAIQGAIDTINAVLVPKPAPPQSPQ